MYFFNYAMRGGIIGITEIHQIRDGIWKSYVRYVRNYGKIPVYTKKTFITVRGGIPLQFVYFPSHTWLHTLLLPAAPVCFPSDT